MRLLLLDRPKDREIIKNRDVEYFGPWAQPIMYPEDLTEPKFEPYPTPGSVYSASIRSLRTASEVFDTLYRIMPDVSGVRDKNEHFWRMLFGNIVVTACGIAEDIFVRSRALPENDYILGLPAENNQLPYPHTWSESLNIINHNDHFRSLAMALILGKQFNIKEQVEYNYHSVNSFSSCVRLTGQVWNKVRRVLNNPDRIYEKWLKFYIDNISVLLQKQEKIHSIVWDHPQYFISIKAGAFAFKETVFREKKSEPYSITHEVDYDKREQIRSALPFPIGDLLAQSIPVSALEGMKDLVESIDLSRLKKYTSLKKVYSYDWNILVGDDFWRTAAALTANEGLRLIAIQPAGMNYYSAPVLFFAGFIFNEYISCGMDDWHIREKEKYSIIKPRSMPDLYLSRLRKTKGCKAAIRGKKKKWKTILVVYSEDKEIKWLYSPLFPDLAYDYFSRQKILFDFFQNERQSLVKLFHIDYGWNHKNWIDVKFPKLQCEMQAANFVDYIKDTEIAIIDYSATAFREMLALGSPFLFTWNRRWYRGNDLFEECMDKLEQVGVFYDHPNRLIESYEKHISQDIYSWWNEKKRKEVIDNVSKYIALTSENADMEWYYELKR